MALANPGRVAAGMALVDVEHGAHVEEALAEHAPEGVDRGLAWFLALGVLRNRGRIDAALRVHVSRPLASLEPAVRAVLRIGAYEKLYARTAPHAVVHQAVEVCVELGVGKASGLVNAVLRRVEQPEDLSRAESLAHPDWLVDRWTTRYGVEATDAWCRANNEPPPLSIVCRHDEADVVRRFTDAGLGVRPVVLHGAVIPGVLRVEAADRAVTALPGFGEGAFWVQDPASVAAADLVPAGPGVRVLDACAAPGGKAFRTRTRGSSVVAVDREEGRLQLLASSARRLGLDDIAIRVHDWTTGSLPDAGTFDVVLVDAPCTGLGTVRRHPEIKWRRAPRDLAESQGRQRAILDAVRAHVKPGGHIVYAVCSPEPEEGPHVVAGLVSKHGYTLEAELSTAPPTDDEDAFYGARLRAP